jgi:hypothetical protein
MPNAVQSSVGQRAYHVHGYRKCNNDTQLEAFFGWMWDWLNMLDSINNKCEPNLLFKKNANAFLGFHCSLGMSSSLQNPHFTK